MSGAISARSVRPERYFASHRLLLWIHELGPYVEIAASSAQAEAEALVVDVVAGFTAWLEEEGLREVEGLFSVAIDA